MKLLVASLMVVATALPALSTPPEQSMRPIARGTSVDTDAIIRPVMRPASKTIVAEPAAASAQLAFLAPGTSPYPFARPESLEQKILFGKRKKKKGSVCGIIDVQGEPAGNIPGKIGGCGVNDAVKVKSVSGVMLSQPAVMDCGTAEALNTWVKKSVIPTFRQRGPVVEMRVAAHYICRTRNNQPGGKISEHGKGKAIDISAFTMKDGEVITVLEGWKRGSPRRLLQKVWKGACGPFGTVLGPEADRYHKDHFHFDTANHRGGPYCR